MNNTTVRVGPGTGVFQYYDHHIQLFRDGKIDKTGLLVLELVRDQTHDGGRCWATDDYLARSVDSSPKTVANTVSKLVGAGMLERKWRNGRRWLFLPQSEGSQTTGTRVRQSVKTWSENSRGLGNISNPRKEEEIKTVESGKTALDMDRSSLPGNTQPARSVPRHTKPAPVRESLPASREGNSDSGRGRYDDSPTKPAHSNAGPPPGVSRPAPRDRSNPEHAALSDNKSGPARSGPTKPDTQHPVVRPAGGVIPRSAGIHSPNDTESGVLNLSIPTTPKDTRRKPTGAITPAHFDMAESLKAAVDKARRGAKRWNLRSWADQFRIACQDYGEDTVKNVLKWYLEHLTDEYSPVASCAKSFRYKFPRLVMAVERHQKRNPTVEVSPAAAKIAQRSVDQGWPKGVDAQIPAFAQQCLDAATKFSDCLERLSKDHPDRDVKKLAEHLRQSDFCDPVYMTDRHLDTERRRVADWPNWSAILANHVWSPTQRHAAGVAAKVVGDRFDDEGPTVWKRLLEAVK